MKNQYKLKVLLPIILSFYTVFGFCNNIVYSLENQLQITTDIDLRLTILQQLAGQYSNIDYPKYVLAAHQGVAEAEQANHEKWMPIYHEMLGRGYANNKAA